MTPDLRIGKNESSGRRYCANMWDYLEAAEQSGLNVLDIAKIAKVDPSSVSRWISLGKESYSSLAPARRLKQWLDSSSPSIDQSAPVEEDRNLRISEWLEQGRKMGLSVHILAIKT